VKRGSIVAAVVSCCLERLGELRRAILVAIVALRLLLVISIVENARLFFVPPDMIARTRS
jgi:hypothetical protein